MVTRLGTTLGTQLGTDLSTFADNPPVPSFDTSKSYAITGFSAANYFATQVGGGEAGDAAGFGGIVLGVLTAFPASGGIYALNSRFLNSAAGWQHIVLNTSGVVDVRFGAATGAGGFTYSAARVLTSSDLNRVFAAAFQHNGTQLLSYFDRAPVGSPVAIAGFTPGSARHMLGYRHDNAAPFTGGHELGAITWRGTPTLAQIQALYDAIRALGDIPSKAAAEALMPGTTVTHRWSLKDVLAAANVPVTDGQAAPATIADSVTAASVDAMTKTGSPVVRVIDPSTPKIWSYETSPILYGASALDLSNYYTCSTALGEGTSSFWVALLFTVTSQAVASKSRVPFASSSSAPTNISGFLVATSGTNTLISMTAYNGLGGGVAGPSGVIAATDVGKLLLYVGVLDVPALKVRTYWKRLEQGTGTAYTAYSASSAGMRLGRTFLATDYSPDGIAVWGVSAGVGLPTLAQVQALYDQTQATERIGSIPGLTTMRVDLTADALANGNVLPPTLTDRAGSFNFTQTGAVTTASTYARAFGW